jgi:hypothetical protein
MKRALIILAAFMAAALAPAQSHVPTIIFAKAHPGGVWKAQPTRTLSDLPGNISGPVDSGLSRFGGLLAHKVRATGFFYSAQIDGRWWLVDPEGCLFLDKGVNSVKPVEGANSSEILQQEFGDETNWAAQTASLLRLNGFNTAGAWSDADLLRQTSPPLPYTRVLNFMSGYGEKRGGLHQEPGHVGYPEGCIFVFDPGFEAYCDAYARRLAQFKNDPWLLGYFSDNEMPLYRRVLKNYLKLPPQDSGYQAALTWLQARHGSGVTLKKITPKDEKDFLALVVARYFRIVSSAIKKYDPNHMLLGSRFHGEVVTQPEVFKAAGPYVDVVSINYYGVWTPSRGKLAQWAREAGKPILITEWYAMAGDSGLPNIGGAGWVVKTQTDRGLFYQNFALALLQSKSCVGWNWFKYADNDPTDAKADPSNRAGNKGIVNIHYQPYLPLLEAMKQLNTRAYSLAAYFSGTAGQNNQNDGADGNPAAANEN